MALALGFISIWGGGVLAAFLACACIISRWYFSVTSSNSSSGQWLLCILCMHLRLSSWFCLVQHSDVGAHMLSSISPPSSPYSGESGPLLYSFFFSIELTVQCDECLV